MPEEKMLIDEILAQQHQGISYLYLFESRFAPGRGWYACTPKPRFHGDTGEFLGESFDRAIANAANIYGLNTWGNQQRKS